VQHSERLWPARLRWRMRGAWLWPAFFGLTAVDGALIALLPPYDGAPSGPVGGVLLAGFANLLVIAVPAPLAGRALRRRRRDLPRAVASDYAGAALMLALTLALLAAGLVHRPAEAAERGDEAAVLEAVQRFVGAQAPHWRPGLGRVDAVQLAPEVYRACVPGDEPRRALCLIVDTDQRPAVVARDDSMVPN
jgi:4-amino-4-deoxy-L-arabinose transferase-like glycosyltransferase